MKPQLKYALINSAIAGALVFFGSFTSGQITIPGLIAAFSASMIVFLSRCKDTLSSIKCKKGTYPGVFSFYG